VSDGSQQLSETATAAKSKGFLRAIRVPLILAGPIAIAGVVAYMFLTGGRYQSTDNAYIQVAKAPVSSSVGGRVIEVLVKENQRVEVGQPLFRIDAVNFDVEADQARAQLAQAELQVHSLRAAYQRALSSVTNAQQTLAYARRELKRQQDLVAAGVVAQQVVDEARHTLENAQSGLSTAEAEAATALANIDGDPEAPIEQQPSVMAAQARLKQAEINRGYTEVKALTSGTVTRVDQLQVGGYVNPAQTVFWLMNGTPWVEANFKEDQLAKMATGEPAEIKIDACPGQIFQGKVTSFSPGTGSTFSALPAQNATGNWVKVTQRLPVQVAFNAPPPENCTRAGLSAHVTIDLEPTAATAK
jgi:membrane fusion protein (multidrug efflux system)